MPEMAATVAPAAQLPAATETCLAAPGKTVLIAVGDEGHPGDVIDPVYHSSYHLAVDSWVQNRGQWECRFRVHYQPGARSLALKVADLLARLVCYGREHFRFGVPPADDTAFMEPSPSPGDFYLDNADPGGGKELDGTLYIIQAGSPRNPVELASEVAHEFSHLTVPGIRGFGPPEDWSNGYLGEVLYLQWLADDPDQKLFSPDEIAQWSLGRETGLISKFLALGPAMVLDEPALHFWGFEGMLFYLRRMYGMPLLSRLLKFSENHERQTIDDVSLNLGYAMAASCYDSDSVIVLGSMAARIARASAPGQATGHGRQEDNWQAYATGAPLTLGPGDATQCWVYLRRLSGGRPYTVSVKATGTGWKLRGATIATHGQWRPVGTLTPTASSAAMGIASEAWYNLQWRNIGTGPVTIQQWKWTPSAADN
jgi:hypothetical protein